MNEEKEFKPDLKKDRARRIAFLLIIILLIVALDQVAKAWALARLQPGISVPIIPALFDLSITFNRGAAFGMFATIPDPWRLILLSIATFIALGAVWYFFVNDYRHDSVAHAALGMILGGAFGNVIDRIRFGFVVDFLDFYWENWHWPAFNIADSSICLGVFILIFRQPRRDKSHT